MSAYEQNFVYRFGKEKPDAKPNIMSGERLKQICESAEKYLNEEKNENKKGTSKH